jgi:glutathione synthase/RimK-type ligase-like ATP-grasp enzyme
MQRQAPQGSQVNNLERGGRARAFEVPAEAKELAIAAAAACGAEISAVDVVYWEGEWWVLEINSSPGYSGMVELEGPAYHHRLSAAISSLFV